MEITKSFKKDWGAALFGAVLGVLTLAGATAFAASGITPGIFTKLVGLFVQPLTTSYSYSTQLQTPAVTAASSTTAGGSLTRGPLVVEVAALTLTGTSLPSNEIATSTQGTNSEIQYAIYIGTTTARQ